MRSVISDVTDPDRIWSRTACEALFHRIVGMTSGGGETYVSARMSSISYLRWARNRPAATAIVRSHQLLIRRVIDNVDILTEVNQLDDASLKQAIAQVEQRIEDSSPQGEVVLPRAQQYLNPPIWSDATFHVTKQVSSDIAENSVSSVVKEKMLTAGYVETRTESWAIFNTKGLAAYAVGTAAQYSETVRSSDGTASGWAGMMHTDWSKLNVADISAQARQKCMTSSNPRAIEPGRYTTILEPTAVSQLMLEVVGALDDRMWAEYFFVGPFTVHEQGKSKIGQKVMDERITISSDPMDPDCSYIPFDGDGYPYRPVKWIENGVLKELSYDINYARQFLQTDETLPNPYAFRMSGGDTSLEEMIASTDRGVLVTHFDGVVEEDINTLLCSSVTRDGLWLIENGKIKCPVKNMRVLESPLYICNKVLQLGRPERTFGAQWAFSDNSIRQLNESTYTPGAFGNLPIVVPPMKVQDFNFVALVDAV